MLLKLTAIFVVLIITGISAQTADDELFKHINLDYPGLEDVKEAYQKKDIKNAQIALLKYFNNRTNRKIDWDKFDYDKDRADRNAKNIFSIKSISHDFGKEIDWTVRQKDKEWQFTLNRMKWFLNYVGMYKKTGDEKYVQVWMSQIDSWIKMADPGYPRTLDTGRRVENWVISYLMFVTALQSPSVTPEFNCRILLSLFQQAEFLYNPDHWRRYSNWGTFENSGFSQFILMFPEFKDYDRWLKEIYFRMDFQLANSFHPDGMHIEVSPSYHSHELGVWLDFVFLASLNGIHNPWHTQIPLSPLKDIFYRCAFALMNFYKPTGYVPQVGDTDMADERHLLRKMGEFWDWPEMVFVATNGREGTPPTSSSVDFPAGGYFIQRSGWGNADLAFDQELYLLFDCGTNQPWHAHYDMLNIVATAYGHDLLKDPGRFTYNDGEDRNYFKSTAAHNTIVIDGQDQPQKYTPPKAEWHSLNGFDYVIGQQNSNPEVSHQRSILFVKPDFWIIIDRLTGTGEHTYDQYWHLSEDALNKIDLKNDGQEVSSPNLKLFLNGDNRDVNVENGYLSYTYRKKIEAPIIRRSASGNLPVIWPTVLYPYQSEEPEVTVEKIEVTYISDNVKPVRPIALQISTPSEESYYLEQASSGTICSFSDFETDARMVYVSLDKEEKLLSLQMAKGSFLKYRGKKLAGLVGTDIDVSIYNKRVEIVANNMIRFSLNLQDAADVYLNNHEIETSKSESGIDFQWKPSR